MSNYLFSWGTFCRRVSGGMSDAEPHTLHEVLPSLGVKADFAGQPADPFFDLDLGQLSAYLVFKRPIASRGPLNVKAQGRLLLDGKEIAKVPTEVDISFPPESWIVQLNFDLGGQKITCPSTAGVQMPEVRFVLEQDGKELGAVSMHVHIQVTR